MENTMTDEHKDNLLRNRKQIVANIKLDYILNDLVALKTLTRTDAKVIRSKIKDQRVEYFLDILYNRSNSSYNTFITVLQNSGQESIAHLLEPPDQESNQRDASRPNCDEKYELDVCVFPETPTLLRVLSVDGDVAGMAVMNDELFVVREGSSQVTVYNSNNCNLRQNILITGSWDLRAIVACPQINCLYISDTILENVHRYNLSTGVVTKWPVGGLCYGLSLTSTGNVLVTVHSTKYNQVQEYEPDGIFVQAINLIDSIKHPWQSVKLSSDFLVVCHGMLGSLHRVCIVDMNGHIIQSYGGAEGSSIGQLSNPCDLAVDRYDNVLVADYGNQRVVLLSSSLTHLGYITVPEHKLIYPGALHLDKLTHHLYIAECRDPGRVYVLSLK